MADRRMVYPYTLTAKLAHFPFKFYYDNSPFFQKYIWSIFVAFPIFWKFQQLSCSEGNQIKASQGRKKEYQEILKHKEHLL